MKLLLPKPFSTGLTSSGRINNLAESSFKKIAMLITAYMLTMLCVPALYASGNGKELNRKANGKNNEVSKINRRITPGVLISVNPSTAAQAFCLNGTSAALTVTATGTNLTYQWYSNSAPSNSGGTPVTLPIGQSYTGAGGIVGYILAPGDPGYVAGQTAGLAVSPTDVGNGLEWGCQGTSVATSTAFGTGLANTNAIIAACAGSNAAQACRALSLNGFSDWYLPSKDEMTKFYNNQDAIGGFANSGYYWCSSQCDGTNATGFGFKNGDNGSGCGTKHDGDRARAARSFTITNSFTPLTSTAGTTYYYVVVTSSSGSSATSAVSGPVTVGANLSPSVTIAADATTVNAGTQVTYTASPVNGGAAPSYQWQKNGINVGTNSATYQDAALVNNDIVTVILTSNATCLAAPTAVSNGITMTVTVPAISTSGSLSALGTVYGIASTTGTFSLSGTNMTAGVLVIPPAGFEVSASPSSGFGSTVTIGAAGTIASTPVYIRLAASAPATSYSGNVVLSSANASNVNVATVSSTVSKALLTITANNQNIAYGATLPILTASYSGFVNGDTPASLTAAPLITTAGTSTSAPGPYAITASSAGSNNYSFSYFPGTLTVAYSATFVHIASQPFESQFGNLEFEVAVDGPISGLSTNNFTAITTGVNNAQVRGIYGPYGPYSDGSYQHVYYYYVDVSYRGTSGTMQLQWANATGITPPYIAGLPGLSDVATITPPPPVVVAIGSPSVSSTASGPVSFSVNYSGGDPEGYVFGNLSSSDIHVSTTGSAAVGSVVVQGGGTSFTVTLSSITGNGSFSISIPPGTSDSNVGIPDNGATSSSVTVVNPVMISSITAASPSPTNAGTVNYTVALSNPLTGLSASNFTVTATGTATGTVNSVSGSGLSYTVTVTGVSGDGTLTLNFDNSANLSAAITNPLPFVGQTYNVDHTAPSITIGSPSATETSTGPVTYTVTYADNDFSAATLGTGDITLNTTGTATGTLAVTGSGTTRTVAISDITGTGSLGISIAAGTAADNAGNLAAAAVPSATFTVTPPIQHISFLALPSKTYGDGDFSPGASSDNNGIPVTYSSDNSAVATIVDGNIHITGAGSANITASQAGDISHTAAAGVTQQLSVSQATLTITADNQTKAYGDAVPTLTASYTGFVNGDTQASLTTAPTLSTAATQASHVEGIPYAITASGAVNANYSISYVAGSLSVTPVALTITANDQNMVYGDGLPIFTASYSGFVNGDTQSALSVLPTLSTPATSVSAPGHYAIIASGAVDADYTISYQPGSLTIRGTANASITVITTDAATLQPAPDDNYTAAVGNTVTTIKITATAADAHATLKVNNVTVASGSASDPIALSVGANIVKVDVTAQDGTTMRTYTVTITRAASSIAILASLKLNPVSILTQVSGPDYKDFTTSVPYNQASIDLIATAQDPTATITINSTQAISGADFGPVQLNADTTTIFTTVTAADGITKKTYALKVTRLPSTNALIGTIATTPKATLVAASGTDYRDYTATVANSTSAISIIATAQDDGATLTVNGTGVTPGATSAPVQLHADTTTIYTTVTAADGVTKKTYGIKITRMPSNNALIGAIATTPKATLVAASGTDYRDYTATVANSVTAISIVATTQDDGATLTVNGTGVAPGATSAPVQLHADTTTIFTTVTAADGITKKTYGIKITRMPSNNALIGTIATTPKATLVSASGTDYRDYTATVANSASSISIIATAQDDGATITVNGTGVVSGATSTPVQLHTDTTTIFTTVTAADGITKKTYGIKITRMPSNNALIATIATTPKATLVAASGTDYRDYTATVANSVSSISIIATPQDAGATLTVNGIAATPGVASTPVALHTDTTTIFTTVIAADGITKKTYGIKITRTPSNNALIAVLATTPKASLAQAPGSDYRNYTTTVANSISAISIIATTREATATIMVNGIAATPGAASTPVTLHADTTTIYTTITAGDGITKKTYAILVTRQPPAGLVMKYEEQASPIVNEAITVHQNVSPNGDGNSDALVIEGIAAHPDNKLQIMSRSGQLIYEAKGYDNATKSFDGHSSTNGKLQQPGTYFYSLEYKDGNELKHKTGFIVLKY